MRLSIVLLTAVVLQAQSVSLKKSAWGYIGDNSIRLNNSSSSLVFDFPVPDAKATNGNGKSSAGSLAAAPPPSMNYLYTAYQGSIASYKGISITLQVATTGTPVFNYQTESFNTCAYPAHARAYFASSGVDLGEEFGRWWANPISYTLGPGTVTLTIPLTPDAWSSVFGKFGNYDATTMAMFQEALQTVSYVGLTFGGGCFFGHGVYVTNGTAQFQLISYTIW